MWAPIVYGRTYEVDFRLLALPQDFQQAEQDWIMAHIQVMTRSAEDLQQKPRWAVFKSDRLCVVGIVCRVIDLIGDTLIEGQDLTRDQKKRPLYTFVGYATRTNQESIQLPAYTNKDLRLFRYPYEKYVIVNWQAKLYEERSRIAILTDYQHLDYSQVIIPGNLELEIWTLNLVEDEVVYIWGNSPENQNYLWAAAALQISRGKNVSLCLDLPSRSCATNSPFLNVTIGGITQKEKIIRIPTSGSTFEQEKVPNSSRDKTNQSTTIKDTSNWVSWVLQSICSFFESLLGKIPGQKQMDRRSTPEQLTSEDRMRGFKEKTQEDKTNQDESGGW